MSKVDEQSFVTIIINSHGQDFMSLPANDEQKRTLRKFTVAGVSGNYSYNLPIMDAVIFAKCEDLVTNEEYAHLPFHKKLELLTSYLKSHPHRFRESLQYSYEKLKEKKTTIVPTLDDWFSTAQVSYDHIYSFVINNPENPWERDVFGIWFVDGSSDARKRVNFRGPKISIQKLLGYKDFDFETTLFDVAEKVKKTFGVKYVNFIDLSCRVSYKILKMTEAERLSRPRSLPITAPTPRAGAELIDLNGMDLEIVEPQPTLPRNWKYVRVLLNDNYTYFNTDTYLFSESKPTKGGSFFKLKKKKNSKLRILKKKKSLHRLNRRNLSKRL